MVDKNAAIYLKQNAEEGLRYTYPDFNLTAKPTVSRNNAQRKQLKKKRQMETRIREAAEEIKQEQEMSITEEKLQKALQALDMQDQQEDDMLPETEDR